MKGLIELLQTSHYQRPVNWITNPTKIWYPVYWLTFSQHHHESLAQVEAPAPLRLHPCTNYPTVPSAALESPMPTLGLLTKV
jgi:hypothetical protein